MHNTHITWYIPGKVIYIGWESHITLESASAVSKDVYALMSTAPGKVHVLNDARNVVACPRNVMEIRRNMIHLDHPQLDWLVSLTPPGFVAFLADVVPQMITRTKSRAFTTLELGQTHLRYVDRTLDWNMALDLEKLPQHHPA
ncbi:MAG: hypothetical protein AAF787_07430 [Chloroflexota bacterium]